MYSIKQVDINDITLADIANGSVICFKVFEKDPEDELREYLLQKREEEETHILCEEKEHPINPKLIGWEKPNETESNKPKKYTKHSYKYASSDCKKYKNAYIYTRPNGDIRINFKHKEDANLVREAVRKMMYYSTSHNNTVSCAEIYQTCGFYNYPKESEAYGWITVDVGPQRTVNEVHKSRDSDTYGFTINKPLILE